MCFRFDWRINEDSEFYWSWSAILYPLQHVEGSTNVSQILEIIPPNAGTFVVFCESDQNGFYQPKSIANYTLTVADDSSYFGKTVIVYRWRETSYMTHNYFSAETENRMGYCDHCFVHAYFTPRHIHNTRLLLSSLLLQAERGKEKGP